MKTKTPVCRLLPLLFVAVMMSACVNTLELAVPRSAEQAGVTHEAAVANAREYFYSHFGSSTRSEEQQPTLEAPYVVGNLVPDWESGVTIANEEKTQSDFAMQKDFRYLLLLGEDEAGQLQAVELYSRFVSVEDIENGIMSQYVATYIPSEEYLSSYGAVAQDYGINCSENYEFSGVVLYTLPSGHHIAAYRYAEGELVKGSFLYDSEQTTDENIADFMAVTDGLQIGIAYNDGGTRSDDAIYGVVIEPIVIVDYSKYNRDYSDHFYMVTLDDYTVVKPITNNRIVLGGGGGGGGGTTTTEKKPTGEEMAKTLFDTSNLSELSETERQALNDMLEEIIEDCMGKVLLDSLTTNKSNIQYATSYPNNFDIPEKLINTSAYIYDQNMLVYRGEGVDVLLHELYHTYQYRMINSEETFEASSAKLEIEAQIARTLFAIRRKDQGDSSYYNYLNGVSLGASFIYLTKEYISHTAELKSNVDSKYARLYDMIGTLLHNKLGYNYVSEEVAYSYDFLSTVSKECDDYEKK